MLSARIASFFERLRIRAVHVYGLFVALAFGASRAWYFYSLGIRFEARSLDEYMQYVDPKLLTGDLARSLFYLRDQPPLFNLLLGVVLKLFPRSSDTAFHCVYMGLGLAGALATFFLARRLGAKDLVAAVAATVLFAAPTTLLYENWLFYGYPIAVLLVVSTLGLHRVLSTPNRKNAFFAFAPLALVVLTRGTFHLAFYATTLAAVVLVRRKTSRAILIGALAPSLFAVALYAKHAIVFHEPVIGGFYRGVNLSMMQERQIDDRELQALQARVHMSKACPRYLHSKINLQQLLDSERLVAPPRGVPILDRQWKSTGATNWSSTAAEVVGLECGKVAATLRLERPEAYPKAVLANINRYVIPADETWPFLRRGTHNNADKLRSLDEWVDRNLARQNVSGKRADMIDVALVLAPLSLVLYFFRWRRVAKAAKPKKRIGLSSDAAVALFIVCTLAYTALVVLLFSSGDHNRYRAEVMPLVLLLDVAGVMTAFRSSWRAIRRRRRARRLMRARV